MKMVCVVMCQVRGVLLVFPFREYILRAHLGAKAAKELIVSALKILINGVFRMRRQYDRHASFKKTTGAV